MAVAPAVPVPAVFEFKSATLTLVALVLRTVDLDTLAAGFEQRFGDTPPFDGDPVTLDLAAVRDEALDLPALLALLRRYRMRPLAVRGAGAAQREAAAAAGLADADEPLPRVEAAPERAASPANEPEPPRLTETVAFQRAATVIVDRPLRSGQQVYARGADLVVLALVSHGAEVIADGHVHVWAPLRGRAIAGARGDTSARIIARCMQPQLLAIAGTYRTTETELPPDVLGKAAQVRLDGERLVVEPLVD